MAREPPVELSRPPDEDQLERHCKSNKTHLATPHNSSYSSSNSQNTEAINTAISERELDGIRKINSPEVHVSIHGKSIVVMKSPNHDLYSTKKPTDSIVPIERSREANLERNANKSPEVRTQFDDLRVKFLQIQLLGITPHNWRFISLKFRVKWMVESSARKIPAKLEVKSPEFMELQIEELILLPWTSIIQTYPIMSMEETSETPIQGNQWILLLMIQ